MRDKLTDAKCRAAKAQVRPYKLGDGGALYLMVMPTGGRSWRFVYRFAGKQKQLVLGPYPLLSLADARARRDDAKRTLLDGADPSESKKQEKREKALQAATTFEVVAKEFIKKQEREGASERTIAKQKWLLEVLAKPLADRPIAQIEPPELLETLRKVERRGKLETAKRLRQSCSQVFSYAIATSRATRNPATDLKDALASPIVKHHAAITDAAALGGMWRAIDAYTGQPETRLALKFALLTAARPGEVRTAEWSEVDLEKREWRVPAEKTKMRREWRVPLSDQLVGLIEELRPLSGRSRYLFPSVRTSDRPMSEATLTAALRRMGFAKTEINSHGFRSTFSSHANESGLWSPDVIEAALAHKDKDQVRSIYNRAEYREARARLAQWWADELDRLAIGGEARIIPLQSRALA